MNAVLSKIEVYMEQKKMMSKLKQKNINILVYTQLEKIQYITAIF